jgi:hypothetical protein
MSSAPVIPPNVVAYYATRPMPRGIRNNNPGNIRLGDNWRGLCDLQTDKSFCQFGEIRYGIRALAYILRVSYFQRRALNTVTDIINRWAPTNENDTGAYISAVSHSIQCGPNDPINLLDDDVLAAFCAAIIKHENGAQPYSGLQIVSGVRMLRGE